MEKSGESEPSKFAEAFKEQGRIDYESFSTPHLWWKTDMMGGIKIKSQQVNEGTAKWVGYSLCYIVLVLQTLFFSWTYLKRIVYMAFLTIIAPLVAMTYPIDKMNDGKAQAFDMWLEEYMFSLWIQPVHLLLYIILISSAYKLAATNPIYAIVAIGFIMPAEKLLRKFFGFTKAQTPGALGGAAGAALAFTGLQKIMSWGQKKDKKKDKDKDKDDGIKFKGKNGVNPMEAMAKGGSSNKKSSKKSEEDDGEGSGKLPKLSNKEEKTDTQGAQKGGKTENTGALKPLDKSEMPKLSRDWEKSNSSKSKGYKPKDSKARRTLRTAKSMGKAYTRLLGKKAKEKLKKVRPVRMLAKGTTGLLGGAAFGMAGLALGIAGGDAGKAFQYATAGAVGGYKAGSGVAEKTVDALSPDNEKLKDDMELEWYGDDYKKEKLEQAKEDLVEDEGKIDYIRKTTGASREEAEEILRTTGAACLENDITDVADIATIHEMQERGISLEKAIAAQHFNSYLPSDLNKMDEDDRENHIKRWARMYEEEGYEDARRLAEISMESAELFNKTKSGLKKA